MKNRILVAAAIITVLAAAGCKNPADGGGEAVISIAAVPGVRAPAAGGVPVTEITGTAEYTGTVKWTPAAEDVFTAGEVYTAEITLTAKEGYTLHGVGKDFFTVAGAEAANAENSGVVTAVFPATPNSVYLAAVMGVSAPVTGAVPVTAVRETAQYTGTVAWTPAHAVFAEDTAYTAVVTLTAKAGYTLQGVREDFFTVARAAAHNAADNGVITAAFPATLPPATVGIPTILGVTIPGAGAEPAREISETAQYTGTVAWSPAAAETFAAGQSYTATITLNVKPGYTLEGVGANYFIVAGASSANAANGGVITAAFPETGAPGHTHVWGEWTVTAPAGCTTDGTERRVCVETAHVETRTINRLGHDMPYVWTLSLAPTCDEAGVETRACARSAAHVETRAVEKLGHSYGPWQVIAEPTCGNTGLETRVCARAASHTDARVTEALPHSFGNWVRTLEPSCDSAGSETRACARNAAHVETRAVETLGHSYGRWTQTSAPTCTADGEEVRVCVRSEQHAENRPVKMLGHLWGAWTETLAPTCMAAGAETRACGRAAHPEEREIPVNAEAHDYNWVQVTAPTCLADGSESGTCKYNASHTAVRAIPTPGHNWNPWEEAVAPTCMTAGSESSTCKIDGAVGTRAIPIDSTAHSYKDMSPDWGWVITVPLVGAEDGERRRYCAYNADPSHDDIQTLSPVKITTVNVTGIDAPATGMSPDTGANDGTGYTAVTVTWSPSDGIYQSMTAYTASVTLTVRDGHTFADLGSASIGGVAAVIESKTKSSVTLTRVFPRTMLPAGFTVTVSADNAPVTEGGTLHRSGANGPTAMTLRFENPGQYANAVWRVTGTGISAGGPAFYIDTANSNFNRAGKYQITVEAKMNGVPFTRTVVVTVTE